MSSPVNAWLIPGKNILVLEYLSGSHKNSSYLVGVGKISGKYKLAVKHNCPAFGHCWHEQAAIKEWQDYFGSDNTPAETVYIKKSVFKQKSWQKILLPSEAKTLEQIFFFEEEQGKEGVC